MFYKKNRKTDNPSTRKYLNETENRITFKINIGYQLELLTPETELAYIEVWFTYQNSESLEIEDKITITLAINQSVKYKKSKIFSLT